MNTNNSLLSLLPEHKKNIFFASTHLGGGFYPGTGSENEKGKYNNITNIPMEAGTNSEQYLNAYDRVLSKLKSSFHSLK